MPKIQKQLIRKMKYGGTEQMVLEELHNLPVGQLAVVGMRGCEEIAAKINRYLVTWRKCPRSTVCSK